VSEADSELEPGGDAVPEEEVPDGIDVRPEDPNLPGRDSLEPMD
jgi:hypothetical protein